jgi:D-psicose/D-tagatose/L-ribulose 3-epimerase
MRLSISNLAWEREHDPAMRELLNEAGVDSIDIAPGRYFSDPVRAAAVEIDALRRAWNDAGVEIFGLQALLFGTQGLNVFGSQESQEAMLMHLDGVCRLGAALGARRLVFGSPRNRDATGWESEAARHHAVEFFARLGDVAARHEVVVCLEPNPRRYQCNFMTTTTEAADIVRAVGRPEIGLQFDTGTLLVNGEDAAVTLAAHGPLVRHVHASEPDLAPLGSLDTDHASYGRAIRSALGDAMITIEMLPGDDRVAAARRALALALDAYLPSAKDPLL